MRQAFNIKLALLNRLPDFFRFLFLLLRDLGTDILANTACFFPGAENRNVELAIKIDTGNIGLHAQAPEVISTTLLDICLRQILRHTEVEAQPHALERTFDVRRALFGPLDTLPARTVLSAAGYIGIHTLEAHQ